MLAYPKVLLLSGDEAETETMEKILTDHAVLRSVRDLAELRNQLDDKCDAVLCGWSVQRDRWNATLGEIRERFPDLPVLLLAPSGSEKVLLEALEAGAFDLLVAPYLKHNVLPLLEHAVASHEARRFHNAITHGRAMDCCAGRRS